MSQAKIYLFPVPMGDTPPTNVLPQHNIDLVAGIKHFVVENIRSARRFLKACDKTINIDSISFVELNEHTPSEAIDTMLSPALAGHDIGVVSEAGCPAVADPGADLVAVAQRKGIEVVPLVGPSSIIMSLMGSGFNGQSFAFCGYLPIDEARRTQTLKEMERRIRRERQTQIFIETPYRNHKLIEDLCRRLPSDMLLCVASDITGSRQNIVTRRLADWKNATYNYDKIPTIFLLYS